MRSCGGGRTAGGASPGPAGITSAGRGVPDTGRPSTAAARMRTEPSVVTAGASSHRPSKVRSGRPRRPTVTIGVVAASSAPTRNTAAPAGSSAGGAAPAGAAAAPGARDCAGLARRGRRARGRRAPGRGKILDGRSFHHRTRRGRDEDRGPLRRQPNRRPADQRPSPADPELRGLDRAGDANDARDVELGEALRIARQTDGPELRRLRPDRAAARRVARQHPEGVAGRGEGDVHEHALPDLGQKGDPADQLRPAPRHEVEQDRPGCPSRWRRRAACRRARRRRRPRAPGAPPWGARAAYCARGAAGRWCRRARRHRRGPRRARRAREAAARASTGAASTSRR